jgi:hypothetical protein
MHIGLKQKFFFVFVFFLLFFSLFLSCFYFENWAVAGKHQLIGYGIIESISS